MNTKTMSAVCAAIVSVNAYATSSHLVYHCTFDNEEAITSPVVGEGGTKSAGSFVAGKVGNAVRVPGYTKAVQVPFSNGLPVGKGRIDFYARIDNGRTVFYDAGDPSLFLFCTQTGGWIATLGYAANDGYGTSGLCLDFSGFGHIPSSSGCSYGMAYSSVMGSGDPAAWHHYAIVWNTNGVSTVSGNPGIAVLFDDKVLSSRPLSAMNASSLAKGLQSVRYLKLSFDDGIHGCSTYSIDEFKVFNTDDPNEPEPEPEPIPATPVIKPVSGTTFDNSLTVSMTCTSEEATIHYTTDGSAPTTESPAYTGKFKIYGKTTVRAVAFYADGTPSEMAVAEYAKGTCEDPVISPGDGSVFQHSGQCVSIAWAGSNGVLRVTTDGSEPTSESAEYTGPFTIDETTTIKTKVFSDIWIDSAVVAATLTREWVQVATPVITAQAQFTGSKQRVDITCATDGAVIRYTTNGSDPNSHSTKYKAPFYVTDTTTVKAYATKADYTKSDIATLAITKAWGIGDTMGKPDHAFATSGDAEFVRVDDATATLGESMKSGKIEDEEKSVLSTTVMGPGTLTFRWKTSCEQDDEYEWDHAEFAVDGALKGHLNGITDWVTFSQRIEGEGEHTVTWTYIKDDVEKQGEDCVWVADYAWTSDYTTTQTTDVPVPYAWLTEKSRDIVDEYDIYEKVAKQTAYNPRFTVEQCYVAGLDPESTTNEFTSTIEMVDGVPSITWKPDLEAERTYKIWGSTNLVSGGDWEWPTNALHRFFKVTVEMP